MTIEAAFLGTLGADAERKVSKAGKTYLRMRVRAGDGDTPQWVTITCFDDAAIADGAKFTKGTRCYVEGKLMLDSWRGQDGVERHDLSVLSWHTRLAQIGRNKPQRDRQIKPTSSPADNDFHDDEIPI